VQQQIMFHIESNGSRSPQRRKLAARRNEKYVTTLFIR